MEDFENKNDTIGNSDKDNLNPNNLNQNYQEKLNPSEGTESKVTSNNINEGNSYQANYNQANYNQNIPNQGQIYQVNANQDNASQGNANQGNANQDNSNQGNANQGNTSQGNTSQVYSNQGNINQVNTSQGNTNQVNYNQGSYNQGNYGQSYQNNSNPNYNNPNYNNQYSAPNNQTYNQQNQNRVPNYSFWAEQAPQNNYAKFNPTTNTWEYGYRQAQNRNNSPKPKKKGKKPHKVLRLIGKAACFGLIASISFIGVQAIYYGINPSAAQNNVYDKIAEGITIGQEQRYEVGFTEKGAIKYANEAAISDVVDASIPSIVSINSTSTQTSEWFGQQYSEDVEGSGSGFIVGKNDKELLIATNNHVISGTNKIMVTFIDGTEAEAVVKGSDATADLAVVSVDITTIEKETLDKIKIAKLGNSDDVKVGEISIAIGNALGYGQSVTVGYISAKDREVEVSDGYDSKTMVLLQTDAAINPGNSGGALLNAKGEVIGINTIKYASNEVEGMGYAIPISRATPIINELMSREILTEAEQGYLGISGNDVSEDISSVYNMPIGVFINDLSEGGAAQEAGLMPGDIITAVNEVEITAITQLREYVNSLRVGTKVEVTYMRSADGDYQEGKTTVTLGKNPNLNTEEE